MTVFQENSLKKSLLTPWKPPGHSSQRSRLANGRSLLQPLLLQIHSPVSSTPLQQSTYYRLNPTPLPISSWSHQSPTQNSILFTHCFIQDQILKATLDRQTDRLTPLLYHSLNYSKSNPPFSSLLTPRDQFKLMCSGKFQSP